MSRVDLSFAESCEPWRLESYQFPSKIGGKPAWLDLGNLPTPQQLLCDVCHQPQIFLCQIYAPFEEDDANFHRTVFIFICRKSECCRVKAFRCSLPRNNEYYSSEPPNGRDPSFSVVKWTTLCKVCGCKGQKKCGRCSRATYCGREHQVVDWKEGHKNECETGDEERDSSILFKEFELVIDEEECTERHVDESEEIKRFEEMQRDGKLGNMSGVDDSDMEKYATCETDKAFAKFKKRISYNPDQVLRYERGGQPLWIADEPKPDCIPNCEYCSSPRQYEFQIMPQLLSVLHENELDFGILAVYTCSKSCSEGEKYKIEFVFKQDVKR